MLLIEDVPISDTGEAKKNTISIVQVVRFGVQLVTNLGNNPLVTVKYMNANLTIDDEYKSLSIDIQNDGQLWLRPLVYAEVYDLLGKYIGKFEGGKKRIYPSTSVRITMDLTGVPEGEYKALVISDGGEGAVFGGTYTLKLEVEKTGN